MIDLPAARSAPLTGAAELAMGRAIGFTRFGGGAAELMRALAVMLAVVVASTLLATAMDGLGLDQAWKSLAGSVLLLLAEFAVCAGFALAAGRAGARGRFLAALLWCWALVLAVATLLLLPIELMHKAGGDPSGARSGTLLLGGGFFLLVGLYLVWLNGFLLRRGLGIGAFGAVAGVLAMFVVMTAVGMARVAMDPVVVKGPG